MWTKLFAHPLHHYTYALLAAILFRTLTRDGARAC